MPITPLFSNWANPLIAPGGAGPYGTATIWDRMIKNAAAAADAARIRGEQQSEQTQRDRFLADLPPWLAAQMPDPQTAREEMAQWRQGSPEAWQRWQDRRGTAGNAAMPGTFSGTGGGTPYDSSLSRSWLNMVGGTPAETAAPMGQPVGAGAVRDTSRPMMGAGGGSGADSFQREAGQAPFTGASEIAFVPGTAPATAVRSASQAMMGAGGGSGSDVVQRTGQPRSTAPAPGGLSAVAPASPTGSAAPPATTGAAAPTPSYGTNTTIAPNILGVPNEVQGAINWLLNPNPNWQETDMLSAEKAMSGGVSGSQFAGNQNMRLREDELRSRFAQGAEMLDPYMSRQQGALNIYTQGGISGELARQQGDIETALQNNRLMAEYGMLDKRIAAERELELLRQQGALQLAALNASRSTGGYGGGSPSGGYRTQPPTTETGPNQATLDELERLLGGGFDGFERYTADPLPFLPYDPSTPYTPPAPNEFERTGYSPNPQDMEDFYDNPYLTA